MIRVYDIVPVPKPRMTRRDQWKKRPCVLRYFAFRDQVRLSGLALYEEGMHVCFIVPMPKSWSKKRKQVMVGLGHRSKPDLDNYVKGLLDACFDDDSCCWDLRASKLWGVKGRIVISDALRGPGLTDLFEGYADVCGK